MPMEKKLKKSDQITKNSAYEAVAPDDFASMIEVDRYEQRSSDFDKIISDTHAHFWDCLLYTSPSPRDMRRSRMPSYA